MREPLLTALERQSSAWAKTAEYLEERIAVMMRRILSDLPEAETAKIRGSIIELNRAKEYLADIVPPRGFAETKDY